VASRFVHARTSQLFAISLRRCESVLLYVRVQQARADWWISAKNARARCQTNGRTRLGPIPIPLLQVAADALRELNDGVPRRLSQADANRPAIFPHGASRTPFSDLPREYLKATLGRGCKLMVYNWACKWDEWGAFRLLRSSSCTNVVNMHHTYRADKTVRSQVASRNASLRAVAAICIE
jgi:hypothetical protein